MASAFNLGTSLDPATRPDAVWRAELNEIDASTKWPVVVFLLSAVAWLLVGTVFALISSIKLHAPEFLGDYEWFTFGRARSAHLNAAVYGWSTNAAFGVVFWLMARLSRAKLRHPGILVIAACFWNLGVAIGVGGILKGDSTSIEWLEMPPYATPLLFVTYAIIGSWAAITFRFREEKHIYVSQWYLLAALLWFPWIYAVAQIMLIYEPARGTVQALVNWWFAHNIIGLWFTPIGLGAIYYFIPKVLGKPIYGYFLAMLGFWTLAIFNSWAGIHHLIGGPVPAWVVSASIVASLMMVIPVVVTAINFHMTMVGNFAALRYSPTLRFVVFGAVNYTLVSLTGSAMAIRSVNEITHFTHFTVGHAHQGMYAFFTMVMFGAIYYVMPRILRKEWPSAMLIRAHFWSAAIGVTLYWVDLEIGGWIQGLQMNNPDIPFIEVVRNTVPYLFVGSVAGIVMTIGHFAFAVNIAWMFCTRSEDSAAAPTLFHSRPAMPGASAQ